jgi:hypothetical protein
MKGQLEKNNVFKIFFGFIALQDQVLLCKKPKK